jgi:5,10-methylenetetrahydrofolate reductase
MSLAEAFKQGRAVITAEVGPPKGIDIHEMLENAELLKGWVNAANVTDQQSSVMRLGSLAACHLIKDKGLEPIFQMTCRDRNRLALQSDLLSAAVLGIENVLSLTGDYTSLGDHPQSKPVFDLDSITLLQAAKMLEAGKDLAGKELKGSPHFFMGAVVSPASDPVEPQVLKMAKKVKAGAQFFQTQAVYEPKRFEAFMQSVKRMNVPVLVGIVPLRSAAMARFMNKNVSGIRIPDAIIDELDKAPNKAEKSVEISARLIKEMMGMCQGIHLMAIGWEKKVPAILQAAGLSKRTV